MLLKRKFYDTLLKWKENPNKRALLVTGARQVGKTSIIRDFGRREYRHFVEVNFIDAPRAKEIYRDGLGAKSVLTGLTTFLGVSLVPGETLIFFDEIQECPEARTAIKFLVEDGRFDIIESGSLLGVNSGEALSYPVGFEEIYRMYPMDFEEFAWANGVENELLAELNRCFETNQAVPSFVHKTVMRLFREYVITGGMPTIVNEYVQNRDFARVIALQRQILNLYRLDITKYATNGKEKIRNIFDDMPSQLQEKNRRFKLASIDKLARYNRYEDSFVWLRDAGVALPCYNVREPVLPLRLNEQRSLFKLFMSDTGLLCASGLENVQFDILYGDLNVNLGGILENMMAQAFSANGFELRYFSGKKVGEVDFVLQVGRQVLPVEVKSGRDYMRHASLDRVMGVKEWNLNDAIVFCGGNVAVKDNVRYMPWYMAGFLKQPELPKMVSETDFSAVNAAVRRK